LQKGNQGIIVLDEPTLHLHPIKQQHFWRVVTKINSNQIIVITHSPYLVNLQLFKNNNRLLNIQISSGISKIYPKSGFRAEEVQLKEHNFKPEIFFSNCNIFVEGASDKAAIAAISESLKNNVLEKYSIKIIEVGGKDILEKYVYLLKGYSIPHVALADYDYDCDDEKRKPRKREKTNDFIILNQRLEEELYNFDKSVKTIPNFDPRNPCKTNRCDQPNSIMSHKAYRIVQEAMFDNNKRKELKDSKLGKVFENAVRKAGGRPDKIW